MYSVKPDYMRNHGDPPKDPWMAGETPGVPVNWYRQNELGSVPPSGWGIAWDEPWADRVVIMPIPFNIIGGLIWKFRNWLKWPGFIIQCAQHEGILKRDMVVENQRLREKVEFLRTRVGHLEHQVAPYPIGDREGPH